MKPIILYFNLKMNEDKTIKYKRRKLQYLDKDLDQKEMLKNEKVKERLYADGGLIGRSGKGK